MKKPIIERARNLQNRYEAKISSIKPLSLAEWMQFSMMVCFAMGAMMFIYCIVIHVNPFNVLFMHSPITYMGLAFACSIFWIYAKKNAL